MKVFIALLSLLSIASTVHAKSSCVSKGWIAPYTMASSGEDDWCMLQENNFSVCSLSHTEAGAEQVIRSVVAAWEKDYQVKYQISNVQAHATSEAGYEVEGCAQVTLNK
ncbi:MAG: hypothetical protein J7501_08135 [Bdellovibrio sp.]|nr:hypothetical protein [Bdellovibrio sp.]